MMLNVQTSANPLIATIFQVKNRLFASLNSVENALPVQMNYPVIAGHTQAKRSLCVMFAIIDSCGATILANT